ncbi:MAG: hypothetical protein HY053_01105 [Proteobacteria bacterium]|nr:hypothetical protein [Pseudomonadota bacterium]
MLGRNKTTKGPKYNLFELQRDYLAAVRDAFAHDKTLGPAEIEQRSVNLIQAAFRDAAMETSLHRFYFSVVPLLPAALVLIYGVMEGHVDFAFAKEVAILSLASAVAVPVAISEYYGSGIPARQHGKKEDGYPLRPEARGHKKIHQKAQEKIKSFIGEQVRRNPIPAGFGAVPDATPA